MSVQKFLAGFAVGAAIGAVAGILLAPKAGAETREMLSDTAKDVMEKTDKTVKEIQTLSFSQIIFCHFINLFSRQSPLVFHIN